MHCHCGTNNRALVPQVKNSTMKYTFLYPQMYGSMLSYTKYYGSIASTLRDLSSPPYNYFKTSSYAWVIITSNNGSIGLIDSNYGRSAFNSFMTTIPSLLQFSNNYRFATPSYQGQTYVAIIIRQIERYGLELDSSKIISPEIPYTISNINKIHVGFLHSVITVTISSGWHVIHHTDPKVKFGLIMFGGNVQTSYGLPLGLLLSWYYRCKCHRCSNSLVSFCTLFINS